MSERVRSAAEAVFTLADVVRELAGIAKECVQDKAEQQHIEALEEQAKDAVRYLMARLDFRPRYTPSQQAGSRGGGKPWRRGRTY